MTKIQGTNRHMTRQGVIKHNPRTMSIEEVHKRNFELIAIHNIKVGQTWRNKTTGETCIIKHIHPLYGWVVSSPYSIKQDLSNISEWEKEAMSDGTI